MKKIAYIELDTHAEVVMNFLELMQNSKEFKVDYFLSEKISTLVGSHKNTIISHPNLILSQLKNTAYDLIIIGTVHRYFHIFNKISRRYLTAIIVHNINFSKTNIGKLLKNIFQQDTQYRLKLLLKESLTSAPHIYQNAKHLLVLDENLADSKLTYLPILYASKENKKNTTSRLKVAIAGNVSQKRRDYLRILRQIKNFHSKMEFIFCGKASGEELKWLQQAEKSLPENIKITYFTEKIPSEIFDELMNSADVFWCPIQSETLFMGIPEIYGITKMSGNIGDAIKYQKPIIVPKNYPSNFDFILKEKENIEQQLIEVSQQKFNFENFSTQKVTQKLEQTLYQLIQ